MKKQIQQKQMSKILLVATLFFIMTFSFVSATPLDDLIGSYSFDYYGDEIDVMNISDYMQGSYIFFNVSVANATAGDYTFYVDLDDGENIVIGELFDSVPSYGGLFIVNLSTTFLSGADQFNYTLRIYNVNNSLVYRESNTTQVYSSYDQGHQIINISDSNNANTFIDLNVTLNSSFSSTENVSIFLQYGENFISATSEESLLSGINYILLQIDNETIKSTHHNGLYNITAVSIGEKTISTDFTTNSYNYEDFAKTSYIKNYFSSFVDLDTNDLEDYIEFNFTLNSKQSGIYTLEADIYDLYGNYISTIAKNQSLGVETSNVSINLNGSTIYSSYIDGPYKIDFSRLIFGGEIIDFERDTHITDSISYYDFERPPLPDLNISMDIYYNGSANLVNITISNIGTAPAFNILVDVFDVNSSYEEQKSLASLNTSQNYIFNFISYNGTNISMFIAIVDFNNLVDELNESNNFVTNIVSPIIEGVSVLNETGVSEGEINSGDNITFNVNVTDENFDVQNVWVTIWEGLIGVSNVIWQGFLSFISGNFWSGEVETNQSFPEGNVNYTVYVNDSLGNGVNYSGSLKLLEPPEFVQQTPFDGFTDKDGMLVFECSFIDGAELSQINLYGDFDGTYGLVDTGEVNSSFANYTFYINVSDGGYSWNCEGVDKYGAKVFSSNYSLEVNTSMPIYEFKGTNNLTVASFMGNGDLNIKGNCSVSANCVAPSNSFIIQNVITEETTAYIDADGNLCLESGTCLDNSVNCNPYENAFLIQNDFQQNLSYISFSGELCLTGDLNEYY